MPARSRHLESYLGALEGGIALSAALSTDVEHVTDEELVDKLRKGDETAFNLLYQRYFIRIYRFVDRRLGNRADTEETVQEVFMAIVNSIDGYRGEAPFAAWAFGLTRRTIAGRFKKRRHPTVPLEGEHGDIVQPETKEPTPVESYEYQELLRDLDRTAAHQLSHEQRMLFRMHHLEDRSIAQIADQLGKSEDSVKSNLYRTRKILLTR